MEDIFKVQPVSCRVQLPFKEIEFTDFRKSKYPDSIEKIKRVLFYDPTELYSRIGHLIDPYKRHAGLSMEQCFPKIETYCACGCGKECPSGDKWQRKWATDICSGFASDVLSIINNYFGVPAKYMEFYMGYRCSECNINGRFVNKETPYSLLELDHIIGVKHGGGGCWLSNYEWKCKKCHVKKTTVDFRTKGGKSNMKQPIKNQIELPLTQTKGE